MIEEGQRNPWKNRFSQYLGSEKRIQLGFFYPQLFLGKIRIRIRIKNREDGLGFITTTPPPDFLFFFQKSCFGIKSEPSRNTSCDQGGQRRSSALLSGAHSTLIPKGGGGILREILSSQIRTKSGGACSIGTRKGVSGSGSPRDRNGVENGGRKDATFLRHGDLKILRAGSLTFL